MLSVVGFTVASFLCGLAPTLRLADRLPHHPGRDRRRAAAALAGGAARGLSAAGARQGDGLLGPRHRRRADPRAGARRLAHRQLQLALGLLHQHPGRHRVARDDQAVHLRPAVHLRAESQPDRLLGHRHAGASASARCRSCSTRDRRTTGSRRTLIVDAGDRRASSTLVALHRPRAARPSDPVVDLRVFKERSYAVGVFLMTMRRLRALRQPGAAADHAADAARLSVAAGRHRDGAARHRARSS